MATTKSPPAKRRRTKELRATFARLRDACTSDGGKACIDLAEQAYVDRDDVNSRQWMKAAMSADKAAADTIIHELKAEIERLKGRSAKMDKLDALDGGNVTPIGVAGASP